MGESTHVHQLISFQKHSRHSIFSTHVGETITSSLAVFSILLGLQSTLYQLQPYIIVPLLDTTHNYIYIMYNMCVMHTHVHNDTKHTHQLLLTTYLTSYDKKTCKSTMLHKIHYQNTNVHIHYHTDVTSKTHMQLNHNMHHNNYHCQFHQPLRA